MSDQAVKLRDKDVPHVRAMIGEFEDLSTASAIGAAVFGWRFLTPEQKLAALKREDVSRRRPRREPSPA